MHLPVTWNDDGHGTSCPPPTQHLICAGPVNVTMPSRWTSRQVHPMFSMFVQSHDGISAHRVRFLTKRISSEGDPIADVQRHPREPGNPAHVPDTDRTHSSEPPVNDPRVSYILARELCANLRLLSSKV